MLFRPGLRPAHVLRRWSGGWLGRHLRCRYAECL